MRRHLGLLARVTFGVLGAAFVVVAFLESWNDAQGLDPPAWYLFAASLLLSAGGLCCAYMCWVALLEVPANRPLAAGFYLSQLGKYMPGLVWQALAQVGFTVRTGVPAPQAGTRLVVFGFIQASGGALIGASLAVFGAGVDVGLRALSVLPLLVLVPLLDRRWMIRALRWWQHRRGKQARDDLLPGQRAILLAWLWSAATMMVVSVAFALLLRGTASDAPLVTAVSAFAFAWTIGFLALPFPAGLGVREATLLGVLGGLAPSAAIIAAAVFLRLTVIVAEVAAIGISFAFARLRGRAAPTPRAPAVLEEDRGGHR